MISSCTVHQACCLRTDSSRPSVRAMSAPSMARDRLHVIGSTCRFAGVMPAPKPHSERPGVDRRHRSYHEYRLTPNVTPFAQRRRRDERQLQVCARHITAAAQLMSRSCQQTVRGALACVGRRPTILRVASHCVAPRARSPGPKSCPETGSFDRLVFFAPGRLVWVGWLARRRRSYAIR